MGKTRKRLRAAANVSLADIPAAQLPLELKRRQVRTAALQRRYERTIAKADALRKEIEALGGEAATASGPRRYARNAQSLVEALTGPSARAANSAA